MKVNTFKDLIVWQKSMELVTKIYECTTSFPKEEMYGLTTQVRRAAVSVPSNIAEGSSRSSTKEFIRFLNIANGSLMELETQIMIAETLNMLTTDKGGELVKRAEEISRMIKALKKSLLARIKQEEEII